MNLHFSLKSTFRPAAALLPVVIFCLITAPLKAQQDFSKEHNAITGRMLDFRSAIISKDSIKLKAIFFDRNTPVIGLMSSATENSIKKANPDFQGLAVSTAAGFIRQICSSAEKEDELFYNPVIETDSILASVSFDYVFTRNGKGIQWGREIWSMVFAEQQWLITGINYTIRFPKVEPCPFYKD